MGFGSRRVVLGLGFKEVLGLGFVLRHFRVGFGGIRDPVFRA